MQTALYSVTADTATMLPPCLPQVARTETSELTQHPEFLNRMFILRLGEPLASSLAPQISLHCNLFALPSADSITPGELEFTLIPISRLMLATTTFLRYGTDSRCVSALPWLDSRDTS